MAACSRSLGCHGAETTRTITHSPSTTYNHVSVVSGAKTGRKRNGDDRYTDVTDVLSLLSNKLDGQGKARREAARRRNSECKINLSGRNSSRSNDSWRMSPKSTKFSASEDFCLTGAI